MISKEQWGIVYSDGDPPPRIPKAAPYVIVHHTAGGQGANVVDEMRRLDSFARNEGFECIHYSHACFLTGERAEGRGWGARGGHTGSEVPAGWPLAGESLNEVGYGIVAVGNYESLFPTGALLDAFAETIAEGVNAGWVAPKFRVIGHRDVRQTACPGKHLYPQLKEIAKRAHALLTPVEEDEDMRLLVKTATSGTVFVTDGITRRKVHNMEDLNLLAALGLAKRDSNNKPIVVPADWLTGIPVVT